MSRLVALLCILLTSAGCTDDHVQLTRGPLGPAVYEVTLRVDGDPTILSESVTANLAVDDRPDGAMLQLAVGDEDPITADLKRTNGGRLVLDAVQGVSPGSAGEADLASLVSQLDPPLAADRVRLGDRWSATRRIGTESIDARLTSDLRIIRFLRLGGVDAAELVGDVSGRLQTESPSGVFEGTVQGETRIVWALDAGRVVSSETELVWTIPGTGEVVLRSTVTPR